MDRQSGKFYAVSFDTPLGQALQKYFAEADRCDKAALDFVAHLSDHYTFPPTADAEAVQSADAEAGGLVAVRVSVATLPKPDPILWDSLPDPDSPDHILYFPRVTISSHYIRYGVAHFLDVNAAPDWTFRRNPDGTIRYYHLEKVRNLIPPDDFQRLHEQERPNGTIRMLKSLNPRMRLALGRRYDWFIDSDTITLPPKDSPEFRAARCLFESFQQLPTVPAHTLLRLLTLRHDKASAAAPFLSYAADTEGQRYIFHTSLVPAYAPSKPASPQAAVPPLPGRPVCVDAIAASLDPKTAPLGLATDAVILDPSDPIIDRLFSEEETTE